jgi:chemotaxis protein MotB
VKNPAVIIIRKPKRHRHAAHGGAWKVAYADFVTAMMAFFLVMWLVTQSQAVKQSVGGYFRDPGIYDAQQGSGLVAGVDLALDPQGPPTDRVANPESTEAARRTLERAAGRIKDRLGRLPDMQRLGRQIAFELTAEGLRIELLETTEDSFFDSGSATPRRATDTILAAIAGELGRLGNDVVLEGHTDSRPYAATRGVYTNWELSADRANAARRVMEGAGLRAGQVKGVRGYADTRLRMSDPFEPRNRRVSIVVRNTSLPAAEDVEPTPDSWSARALKPGPDVFEAK